MGRWLLIVIVTAAIYGQLRVGFVWGKIHYVEESAKNSRLRGGVNEIRQINDAQDDEGDNDDSLDSLDEPNKSLMHPSDLRLSALVEYLNQDSIDKYDIFNNVVDYVLEDDMGRFDEEDEGSEIQKEIMGTVDMFDLKKIDRLRLALVGTAKLDRLKVYLFGRDEENDTLVNKLMTYLSDDGQDEVSNTDDENDTWSSSDSEWDKIDDEIKLDGLVGFLTQDYVNKYEILNHIAEYVIADDMVRFDEESERQKEIVGTVDMFDLKKIDRLRSVLAGSAKLDRLRVYLFERDEENDTLVKKLLSYMSGSVDSLDELNNMELPHDVVDSRG